jgi:hypothetical protein
MGYAQRYPARLERSLAQMSAFAGCPPGNPVLPHHLKRTDRLGEMPHLALSGRGARGGHDWASAIPGTLKVSRCRVDWTRGRMCRRDPPRPLGYCSPPLQEVAIPFVHRVGGRAGRRPREPCREGTRGGSLCSHRAPGAVSRPSRSSQLSGRERVGVEMRAGKAGEPTRCRALSRHA